MKVIKKQTPKHITPAQELAAMSLVENLLKGKRKAAGAVLGQIVADNLAAKITAIQKTEPLI